MKVKHLIEFTILSLVASDFVTGISFSGRKCRDGQFKCDEYRCITRDWLCDGTADCRDKTDEHQTNCPDGKTVRPMPCKETQFMCTNGFCLPKKWKCDGADDCGDGSDEVEEMCHVGCPASEFTCGDGQCIDMTWRCNGHSDCADDADELKCAPVAAPFANGISLEFFKCDGGFSMPMRWRCDGDVDCEDKSDEMNCHLLEGKNKTENNVSLSNNTHNATTHNSTTTTTNNNNENNNNNVEDNNASVESIDTKKSSCRVTEFRCPDSFCILRSWICDGMSDCPKGEDEAECKDNPCDSVFEFRCQDGSGCVRNAVKCDGANHCLDGSDELGCPPRAHSMIPSTTTTKASFGSNATTTTAKPQVVVTTTAKPICDPDTHYSCKDGNCILKDKLCNGQMDCAEREDESVEVCGINECSRNNGGCMHHCVDTREGHHCTCAEGYRLLGKYNCEDINECVEVPGSCSQVCANYEGGFRCSCLPGYMSDPADITRCKASEGEVYLLFSHSYDIRSLRLRDSDMMSVVKDTRSAIALDFLFADGKILWSDKKDKKIYRASLNNASSSREVMVSADDITADGLAVDWIHYHVYYTDTARSAINLLSWDAKYAKTIVEEDLGHPRAIVVAPLKGYVFWTDWGTNAKIERAALDGSDRQAIVSDPHVVWPNGITIDPSTERIYWCDGRLRTVSSANLDGSNVKVVLYSSTFLRQPFSISVFEDNIYWTDWTKTALFSANKFTGANIQNVSAGHLLESPKVVHVYHQYRQPQGENVCQSHSCSQLCVRTVAGTPLCTCSDGHALAADGVSCELETGTVIRTTKVPPTTAKPISQRVIQEEENVVEEVEKEEKIAVKTIKESFDIYEDAERSSRVGFIVGGTFGALIAIAVVLVLLFLWTKTRQTQFKSFRFHNPVYRPTVEEDVSDDRGFVIGQDQLFYNPTASSPFCSSKLSISEAHLTDADDAPLTPKQLDD